MKNNPDSSIIGNSSHMDLYREGYLSIFIETTDKCNLNCLYCYTKSTSCFSKKCEPSLTNFKEIISKCESINGKEIFYELSGGEFLLRSDWEQVCQLFLSTGKEVYIYSNATLINKEIAEKIQRLSNDSDGRLKFCSSLDSHIPKIHNSSRGKFKETIRGFDLLKDRGVKLKIYVMLTSYNLSTIYDTFKFITKNYSKEIMLGCVRPAFKITPESRKLFVSYQELFGTAKKLTEIAQKEGWSFFCSLDSKGKADCDAAINRIFINTSGGVTPCYCLRQKENILGNIYTDCFKSILDNMLEFNKDRNRKVLLCEHLHNLFGESPVKLENLN